jgi:hypothetical protein
MATVDDGEETRLLRAALKPRGRIEQLLALMIRIYRHHTEHATKAVAAVARVAVRAEELPCSNSFPNRSQC